MGNIQLHGADLFTRHTTSAQPTIPSTLVVSHSKHAQHVL